MPSIRVELFEGRSVEQKRRLAAALTEAVVATIGGSPGSVDVVFFDIACHDWATGGTLWSDAPGAPAAQSTPGAASQATSGTGLQSMPGSGPPAATGT